MYQVHVVKRAQFYHMVRMKSIMRVEGEVVVKEEEILVAVKFSTAKVKCRSHFD
jgi:hypothetical protein